MVLLPPRFTKAHRTVKSLLRIALVLNLLVLISACLAWIVCCWPSRNGDADSRGEVYMNRPGIQQPPTQAASAARLADEAEVIGVRVDGRSRAYAVSAFTARPTLGDPSHHVVNDLLAGVPVTVSYCDRLHCAQVYTDTRAKTPLPVGVGGYTKRGGHDSLLLCIGTSHYRQDTGEALEANAPPFPYAALPYERTTWKHWRTEHPDTDVYFRPLPLRAGQL